MIILLMIGGAAGAVCRYLLGKFIDYTFADPPFPIAMLTVNILGSAGLGLFLALFYGYVPGDAYEDPLFLTAAVGFFGAFTTFSTFSMESFRLIERKAYKPLILYVTLSVVGSFAAFLLFYLPFL
ncbi:fluoride efflux transporter CrcB [Sinobaca sp. H24]|uniref:fluoride efflux transporter CrcB n=1 Tax=Sinobaca sp. H24 TaxID=2923376 RepID=UPI00207A38A7|nr:fluoride efflux transporter CrcB [Sinobaca sp. H24]